MRTTIQVVVIAVCAAFAFVPVGRAAEFRAGAAIVDVTPIRMPVLVNGGMLSRTLSEVASRLSARAIVLDDGSTRLGLVVVDSCMIPRPLLDDIKQLASQRTGLKPNRILISATHTHSAPASMGCLGTNADPTYTPYLREKIAEALATAEANLEPARVGWGVADAAKYTALRRWIRRPDRIVADPFGNETVRANMHAGSNWDLVTGESGPADPQLSMMSIQSRDGRPIALLANFSMHYFSGEKGLSADYFGLFCRNMQQQLGDKNAKAPFVALMSHGCSGDIWRRDYKLTAEQRGADPKIADYAAGLAGIAAGVYGKIEHRPNATLEMAERRMTLKYRVPNKQRLEWAQRIVEEMGEREPRNQTEVYAREQIILHERQSTEIVVQAIRIGDICIATTPCETYALTGIKLKLQSPRKKTMVIELANGGDGYIPPPEQHLLGGYNTWSARSAGLEVAAEPKIVAALLSLLEQVAGSPRRNFRQGQGTTTKAILAAKPIAFWRLDELNGPLARDSSGNDRHAQYEPGGAFFLAGPQQGRVAPAGEVNRAAHFAGGRLRAELSGLKDQYTVAAWIWNGMPTDARENTGWIFSRGRDYGLTQHGEHLGLGGGQRAGKLVFQRGGSTKLAAVGKTAIDRWTWRHVAMVRGGNRVRVHLDGNPQPEIETESSADFPAGFSSLFVGGRSDRDSSWEGRLDEVVVFGRALSPDEVAELFGQKNP